MPEYRIDISGPVRPTPGKIAPNLPEQAADAIPTRVLLPGDPLIKAYIARDLALQPRSSPRSAPAVGKFGPGRRRRWKIG